jgi:hypothetical protein
VGHITRTDQTRTAKKKCLKLNRKVEEKMEKPLKMERMIYERCI